MRVPKHELHPSDNEINEWRHTILCTFDDGKESAMKQIEVYCTEVVLHEVAIHQSRSCDRSWVAQSESIALCFCANRSRSSSPAMQVNRCNDFGRNSREPSCWVYNEGIGFQEVADTQILDGPSLKDNVLLSKRRLLLRKSVVLTNKNFIPESGSLKWRSQSLPFFSNEQLRWVSHFRDLCPPLEAPPSLKNDLVVTF